MTIGQAIRSLRKRKKSTLEDVAFAAHTTASNLSRIELGKHHFSADMLANIASALGVTIVDLYREAETIGLAPNSISDSSGNKVSSLEMLSKDQTALLNAFGRLSKRDKKVVWSLINQLSRDF